MNGPLARWSSLTLSKRLRVIGALVLVLGIAGAGLFYWIETRSMPPTLDDLLPGYSRNRARQVGILIGAFGVTLLGWLDAIKEPGTQAVIMAAVSAIVALACFRVAWLLDQRDRRERRP